MTNNDTNTKPTMTQTGQWKCNICGEYYSDMNGAYRCTMEHMHENGDVKTDFDGMWR